MTGKTHYRQACLEAWINCENLLAGLACRQESPPLYLQKIVDECACVCMETWQAIKCQSKHIKGIMVLCIGICEECAEVCEHYSDDAWCMQCAKACRKCANRFADQAILATFN